MFLRLFLALRAAGLPTSLREYLDLLTAVRAELPSYRVEDFYALARTTLIKHERHYDTFDRVFALYMQGIERLDISLVAEVPEAWLQGEGLPLTPEDWATIEALGGLEALQERLRQLLEEQDERHAGGTRWVGPEGTSPYGQRGANPDGLAMGEGQARRGRPWNDRPYRDLRDDLELNTRAIKLALRQLRRLTREGIATELDLDTTIDRTSRNAGLLDLAFEPAKQNRVKVLLLIDVGGSMDPYARLCSELFSAARHEFKHLEQFYFHNCIYEYVWRDSSLRNTRGGRVATAELLRTYGPDYKLIVVGDAAMSPYELMAPGGSLDHPNPLPGIEWIGRLVSHYPAAVWLNPEPVRYWSGTHTLQVVQKRMEGRMFPLTLEGLAEAVRHLKRPNLRPEGWQRRAA